MRDLRKVKSSFPAPLHDAKGNLRGVASYTNAAYLNAVILEKMGEIDQQADMSEAGAMAVVAPLKGRPTHELFARYNLLSPRIRKKLEKEAEKNFKELTGQKADFTGNPFLTWADRSVTAVTSDGYILFGLRSNKTIIAVGQAVPTGIGWASVDENGNARDARKDARRELKEEFNLKGRLRNLGLNFRDNTLGPNALECEDGTYAPGVIPAFSYAGYTQLTKTLKEVLPSIRLNHENFGVLAVHVSQLGKIAKGQRVRSRVFYSQAKEAQQVARLAEAMTPDKTTMIENLRSIAKASTTEKIPLGSYELDLKPRYLEIARNAFTAVGRDFLAESILIAQRLFSSAAANQYAAKNATLEPMPKKRETPFGPSAKPVSVIKASVA